MQLVGYVDYTPPLTFGERTEYRVRKSLRSRPLTPLSNKSTLVLGSCSAAAPSHRVSAMKKTLPPTDEVTLPSPGRRTLAPGEGAGGEVGGYSRLYQLSHGAHFA
jgi:hypothetical protein